MITGFDIQRWEHLQEKAKNLEMFITTRGESLVLTSTTGYSLGCFSCVKELLSYLQGYEWGTARSFTLAEEKDRQTLILDILVEEAQTKFPIGSEVPREEILAWLGSRKVHWFHTKKEQK